MIIDLDQDKNVLISDLSSVRVKGYHCTRAIRDHISSVGIKRFDLDERIQYLDEVLEAHGLSRGLRDHYFYEVRKFINGHNLNGRMGLVCFCLNEALFRRDNGCDSLFRYFGGEAMYKIAECMTEFDEVKRTLETIGEPLVITASVPLCSMLPFQAERVMKYLSDDNSEYCEAFITEDLPPSEIINIEVYHKYL